MLVKINCLSQDGPYERVMNTRTVIYFDQRGVMFAPGTHARLAQGEYERVMKLLNHIDPERVIV